MKKLKSLRTLLFFSAVSALGVVTMLESTNIQAILLPALCHVDLETAVSLSAMTSLEGEVPTDCVANVVRITGAIMLFLGVCGKALRFITTTPIFKPEKDE
jgi:hypothetical protein